MSKILEKAIKVQLQHYLENMQILSINQHGFRKNRNTENAIATVTEFISHNLDAKKKLYQFI